MLTKVTSLTVLAPYRIAVRFNDGTSGVHDCSELISRSGSLFEELRRPEFFARATLEYGAPSWPNGFDMDAEWLRREMEQAGELDPDAAAQ